MISYIDAPLTLKLPTGLDSEQLTEERQREETIHQCLFISESLFWIVGQLGYAAEAASWQIDERVSHEALQHIALLGKALLSQAGEQVERERRSHRREAGGQ